MPPKPNALPLSPLLQEVLRETSLARRVQILREARGVTPQRLSEMALVPLEQLLDVESGLELFLSPSIRQKLAKALRVRPQVLQEVEKRPVDPTQLIDPRELIEAILERPDRKYFCPACGAPVHARLFQRRDLEDNEKRALKVQCTRCLFSAHHE